MRLFVRRVAIGVLGAALAMSTLVATPAHAETPTLSGTVTDVETGAPVSACVEVFGADGQPTGSGCTDPTGHWTAEFDWWGAGPGPYTVRANPQDNLHVRAFAPGVDTHQEATAYASGSVVDIKVKVGARAEGQLTNPDGTPAWYANTSLENVDTSETFAAQSDFNGGWTAVVPAGSYRVMFENYPVIQWAYGQDTRETAQVFAMVAGETTTINDSFLPRSALVGNVVSKRTGDPVHVCLEVLSDRPDDPEGAGTITSSCSDEQGRYSVEVPAGDYKIRFWHLDGTYATQYNGDVFTVAEAPPVTVAPHAQVRVDARLADAARISGVAVDARSGAPVADACPYAFVGRTGAQVRRNHQPCSGADGVWEITGLPPGDFTVLLTHAKGYYADQWAPKSPTRSGAELYSVAEGERADVNKVKLIPGGRITGRVTDGSGQPVAGAFVTADGQVPWAPEGAPLTARTDSDGRYTIQGVPAGTYRPVVYCAPGDCDYVKEWSGDASRIEDATPIEVRDTKATTFNVGLARAAHIVTHVVNADGTNNWGWWLVSVYDEAGEEVEQLCCSVPLRSGNLAPGDYKVKALDLWTYEEHWYGGTSLADATPVTVESGQSRDITITLP